MGWESARTADRLVHLSYRDRKGKEAKARCMVTEHMLCKCENGRPAGLCTCCTGADRGGVCVVAVHVAVRVREGPHPPAGRLVTLKPAAANTRLARDTQQMPTSCWLCFAFQHASISI